MPSGTKSARKPDAPPLAGARVLVVDDHPFTISLIKDVLYTSGVESVHSAKDGAEAIAMLRLCQPTVVITDWRMPKLDGLAFTQFVRQAAVKPDPRVPDPQVPIVLLSAHASTKAVETARVAGVNEVVVKPFAIATLVERLSAAVVQPRAFIACETYAGPDRRRRDGPSAGRRASERGDAPPVTETAQRADITLFKLFQMQLDANNEPIQKKPARRGWRR